MKKTWIFTLLVLLFIQFSFAEVSTKQKLTYGELLQQVQLIQGDGQGLNPDGVMKRQEVMALFNRMSVYQTDFMKFQSPAKASFQDVPRTNWAYKDIEFAKSTGLTKGIAPELFGYDQKITANQFAVFTLRALAFDQINQVEFNRAYEYLGTICTEALPARITDGNTFLQRKDMFEILYNVLISEIPDSTMKLKFYDRAFAKAKEKDKLIALLVANKGALITDEPEASLVENNSDDSSRKIADFSLNLLTKANAEQKGANVLLSPTSILNALAMTANGADGETKAQMEKLFAMDLDSLNAFLKTYNQSLSGTEGAKFNLANSIWLNKKDAGEIKADFLSINQEVYQAEVYTENFVDKTADMINHWVYENTNKRIDSIIDRIEASAVMYLINALSFDGEWQEIYTTSAIEEGEFTTVDGKKQPAKFMHSKEKQYLETPYAKGFIKDYVGGQYAFAALRPKDGVRLTEALQQVKEDNLWQLLSTVEQTEVEVMMPKFKSSWKWELNALLKDLGMRDAFDQNKANFSKMAESLTGNIYIDSVIHKSFIEVDERGTKAGAVTAVIMMKNAMPLEFKEVRLDGPFLYMIIDKTRKLPIFIGTINYLE